VTFFLQANWIVGFVSAWFYFMGGRHEAIHGGRPNYGPVWALASILMTVAAIQGLNGGWLLVVLGQIVLFAGIAVWRALVEN
jgi:hypothetical protein